MVPEFVGFVIGHVNDPPNLLNCACVNRTWSIPALQKLYRGSINDMRYRTPDIGSLNSLFVASRERFARNVSFIKHLLIAPENTGIDETAHPDYRYACIERCRPLRDRKSAELLLRPRGKGPASLAIPFEIVHQDLSTVSDLILHPGLKFLTIDHVYCELLELDSGPFQEPSAPPVSPLRKVWFSLFFNLTRPGGEAFKSHSTLGSPVRQRSKNREALQMARALRSRAIPD